MQSWWKNPRVVGTAAYYVMKLLRLTMRVQLVRPESIDQNSPYLFAFWHGKQFLPATIQPELHHTPMYAMVSPSRDGAMLTVFLEKIGYSVIRGSSRDGGTRALLEMKQALEHGGSVGFGIDGPIGPIHVVKPGIAYLAQSCGIKIIPVASAFSRYWIFNKAWDKFQLPKPFSKAVLLLGEPFTVNEEDDIKSACLELERRLQQTERKAGELIK